MEAIIWHALPLHPAGVPCARMCYQMKTYFPLRSLALASLLMLVAVTGSALTLGRAKGVALIGRPLDLTIPVILDAGDDAPSSCVEADVFHGDTRISSTRINVRLDTSSGTDGVIRVQSSAPVDEPVVTVYLRVGCLQKITKRYVLLAEFPGEITGFAMGNPSPAAGVRASVPAQVPAPAAAAGSRVGSASARRAAPRRASAATAAPAAVADTSEVAPVAPRANAAPASVVRKIRAQSRLKLEPLDLSVEREPVLRTSPGLLSEASGTPQQRADAAALWKVLNAQPLEALRDAQRLQALEADVKGLRELALKNTASLDEMRAELKQARDERYSNVLVYALVMLLAMALALAGYLWRKGRSSSGRADWWHGRDSGRADLDRAAGIVSGDPQGGKPVPMAVDVDFDLDVAAGTAPIARPSRPAGDFGRGGRDSARGSLPGDFLGSQPASMRAVKAEELHDIQQQAEFFVSLGEHEQAIAVLRSHIHAHPETSALAWLDLLEVYYKLSRRQDYQWLREEFERVFNAQIPSFENYRDQSDGLIAYEAALQRIEALWPSPKVLDVIEETIFRRPGADGGPAFDLGAYRELLLLYNIGKEVIHGETGASERGAIRGRLSPDSGFGSTSIQPLSADVPVDLDDDSAGSGLDINLDEDPAEPRQVTVLGRPPAVDPASNLMEFDAFDTATARIGSPKKPPRG